MFILRFAIKNALRHKLRTALTIVGIAIAVMSYGFMRTIVDAWYAGVEASAANRMIARHAVSFIFPLPIAYRDQIVKVAGVSKISYANWFGGVYKDVTDWKNFFPRIAVDPETFFSLYPEYIVSPDELDAFKKERNSCVVGAKLAREHGFKIGDIIPLEGDIYPGKWEFVVRAIYRGRDASVDETGMFFHWQYLDEQVREHQPGREGQIGWYIMNVDDPAMMAGVAKTVDDMFFNSRASTKTETEKEFQQSFVSMSSAIITSLKVISFVIIGIILLVLANTMVMAARERTREYAVLKTLGYSSKHVFGMIGGESMVIASIGGFLGIVLTFPVAGAFAKAFPTFFPIFNVEPITITLSMSAALFAGVVAAAFPIARTLNMQIVDGLRTLA